MRGSEGTCTQTTVNLETLCRIQEWISTGNKSIVLGEGQHPLDSPHVGQGHEIASRHYMSSTLDPAHSQAGGGHMVLLGHAVDMASWRCHQPGTFLLTSRGMPTSAAWQEGGRSHLFFKHLECF